MYTHHPIDFPSNFFQSRYSLHNKVSRSCYFMVSSGTSSRMFNFRQFSFSLIITHILICKISFLHFLEIFRYILFPNFSNFLRLVSMSKNSTSKVYEYTYNHSQCFIIHQKLTGVLLEHLSGLRIILINTFLKSVYRSISIQCIMTINQ